MSEIATSERISELLRLNNQFEERARVAERELAEWEQAASVEAGLRREFIGKTNRLAAALRTAIKVANEAREEWDKAPATMKAGKLLIALSDRRLHYRADITEMHKALDGVE